MEEPSESGFVLPFLPEDLDGLPYTIHLRLIIRPASLRQRLRIMLRFFTSGRASGLYASFRACGNSRRQSLRRCLRSLWLNSKEQVRLEIIE